MLEYLLSKCDVNSVDDNGGSALLEFMKRSIKTDSDLQLLIDHGADIHFVDRDGKDLLDYWFYL